LGKKGEEGDVREKALNNKNKAEGGGGGPGKRNAHSRYHEGCKLAAEMANPWSEGAETTSVSDWSFRGG
jgi:hypothetical protein